LGEEQLIFSFTIFSPHLDDEDIIFLGIGDGVIFFQDGVPMWRSFMRIPWG
jgi:hypothetical protein